MAAKEEEHADDKYVPDAFHVQQMIRVVGRDTKEARSAMAPGAFLLRHSSGSLTALAAVLGVHTLSIAGMWEIRMRGSIPLQAAS
jgi:hypothetical protein